MDRNYQRILKLTHYPRRVRSAAVSADDNMILVVQCIANDCSRPGLVQLQLLALRHASSLLRAPDDFGVQGRAGSAARCNTG
jgi:hypothetical protein